MSRKRALIVDDSKTAQIRLKRMLDRYDLEVDTALSAEEALSYLSYKAPSVVFMDHLMKGMDGFEAVKIIKSNPHTAMIPIIMYTSKSGDVYSGQARALGAIDVLSKDVIEPSDLDKVLKQLNILPKPELRQSDIASAPPPQPEVAPVVELTGEMAIVAATDEHQAMPDSAPQPDIEVLRLQMTKLMDFHIVKVRQEIVDNTKLLMRRLTRDFAEIKEQVKSLSQRVDLIPISGAGSEPVQGNNKSDVPWVTLFSIFVLALLGLYELYSVERQQNELNGKYAVLSEFVQQDYQRLQDEQAALKRVAQEEKTQAKSTELLDALAWSFNLQGRFRYGDLALGNDRLALMNELLMRLSKANFSGVLVLAVHNGDFCVRSNSSGEFELPDEKSAVDDCELLSTHVRSFTVDEQMSLAFINFLTSSPLLLEGKIRIELESYGLTKPLLAYPDRGVVATAGEWNSVAATNNRVQLSIHPGSAPARHLSGTN